MKKFMLLFLTCIMACSMVMAQEKSVEELENAAKKGDVESMLTLGTSYWNNESFKDAAKWFEKAAKAESPEGKFYLAVAYLQGKGKKKDIDKAVMLMEEAANVGLVEAQAWMGVYCEKIATSYSSYKDYNNLEKRLYDEYSSKAKEWYIKAASNGNKYSIDRLRVEFRVNWYANAPLELREWATNRTNAELDGGYSGTRLYIKDEELPEVIREVKAEEEKKLAEEQAAAEFNVEFNKIVDNYSCMDAHYYYNMVVKSKGKEYMTKVREEISKKSPGYAAELLKIEEEEKSYGRYIQSVGNGFVLREKDGSYIIYKKDGTILFKDLKNAQKAGSRVTLNSSLSYDSRCFIWNKLGKLGYMNSHGKLVIPFGKYSAIAKNPQGNGSYAVILVAQGEKEGAVKYDTGTVLVAPRYDEMVAIGSNGRMLFANNTSSGATYYVIDANGRVLTSRTLRKSQTYSLQALLNDYGISSTVESGGWKHNMK